MGRSPLRVQTSSIRLASVIVLGVIAGYGGAAASAAPATPVAVDPEGFLRIAYAGTVNSLDPHMTTTPVYSSYQFAIYDRLFQLDYDENIEPMLAESFEFSADGASLTLHLRDDVVFHDGSPVDAPAVKASLERGQTVDGSTVATSLAGIAGVEVVDDHTVVLRLDGVGAEIPALLATSAGSVLNPAVFDDPAVDLGAAPPPAAGSGPYVVTESEPGVATSYERAPEYWNESTGLMSGYTITYIPAGATRLAGLRAGDFDLAQITADVFVEAEGYADAGEFSMISTVATTRDLMLNIEGGDLADPEVRDAIALAIDREEFALVQPCEPITQPLRDWHWAYNPEIQWEHDPERAREIIDARGGAAFEIAFQAGGAYEAIATVVQAQLADVGIQVELRPREPSELFPNLGSGELQAVLSGVTPGPDPVDVINRFFLGGANLARGAAADELRAIIGPGSDPALTQEERAEIYRVGWQYIADQVLYVPICGAPVGWAATTEIINLDVMPLTTKAVPDFSVLGVAAS